MRERGCFGIRHANTSIPVGQLMQIHQAPHRGGQAAERERPRHAARVEGEERAGQAAAVAVEQDAAALQRGARALHQRAQARVHRRCQHTVREGLPSATWAFALDLRFKAALQRGARALHQRAQARVHRRCQRGMSQFLE